MTSRYFERRVLLPLCGTIFIACMVFAMILPDLFRPIV